MLQQKAGGITKVNVTNRNGMQALTKTNKHLEITAAVFPACECGKPWTEHGECGGYKPTGDTREFTACFRSSDRVANLLFSLELFIRKMRLNWLKGK